VRDGVARTLKYAALLVAGVVLFTLIDAQGRTLSAPPAGDGVAARGSVSVAGKADALMHVLLALTVVIAVGYLLGRVFRYIGQPPVIGEVVAGIMLGPSLLGRIAPDAAAFLMPNSVAPLIGIIAQFGIILYMFLLGLELNLGQIRERAGATLSIATASIIAPFLLGSALALFLYPRLATNDVPFTSFALFLGVAMAITAFPVLARILSDRQMQRTPLGIMALSCAAINDVAAWCLLALVVGVAQAKVGGALLVLVWTAAFIAAMFVVVRPLAQRYFRDHPESDPTSGKITLVFVAMLLSALAAEIIGIHAIFGAFLLGAIIPHDSKIAETSTRKLEDLVTIVFLPAFFAFTGMRTQIGIVSSGDDWLLCGLIVVVATAGKFGGTFIAARLTGQSSREAAALGTLMNTRGLMELIVLNIGLDMGVISPRLFAMMVIMAIVTTMATTPVLHFLAKRGVTVESSTTRVAAA
jgi:K+:H+ antiporter